MFNVDQQSMEISDRERLKRLSNGKNNTVYNRRVYIPISSNQHNQTGRHKKRKRILCFQLIAKWQSKARQLNHEGCLLRKTAKQNLTAQSPLFNRI